MESNARIAKAKQRGMLPQSNFESYCFYLYMVQHFLIFKAKILEILQEVLSLHLDVTIRRGIASKS